MEPALHYVNAHDIWAIFDVLVDVQDLEVGAELEREAGEHVS